eukprot:4571742-Alexandrium_andersonii.AAC.1
MPSSRPWNRPWRTCDAHCCPLQRASALFKALEPALTDMCCALLSTSTCECPLQGPGTGSDRHVARTAGHSNVR